MHCKRPIRLNMDKHILTIELSQYRSGGRGGLEDIAFRLCPGSRLRTDTVCGGAGLLWRDLDKV